MFTNAVAHAPPTVSHTTLAHFLNGSSGLLLLAAVAAATIAAVIVAWTRSKPWAVLIAAYAVAVIAYVYREPAFAHNTPRGHLVAVALLWLPALAGAVFVSARRPQSAGRARAYSSYGR